MRLRRVPGIEKEFLNYPHLVIADNETQKGKWQQHFANENPVYLEVGMGRGQFLKAMSQSLPNANFIALELRDEVIFDAAQTLGDELKNVAVLRGNADSLDKWFAPQEVNRLYLNFSDPWPKKRHGKRRLTHENFLKQYKQILAKNGDVFFRTDVRQLMEFTLTEMTNNGFSLVDVSLDFHNSEFFDGITTEYEDKKSKHGPIYYGHFVLK
ncbi:MAG: tRNA (guanosine(46)-N7)-methyltransferase TrmB [Clostridiales bacterium]